MTFQTGQYFGTSLNTIENKQSGTDGLLIVCIYIYIYIYIISYFLKQKCIPDWERRGVNHYYFLFVSFLLSNIGGNGCQLWDVRC